MSMNPVNQGLYPIIRRIRRPLIDVAAEVSPPVEVPKAKAELDSGPVRPPNKAKTESKSDET